MKSYLVTFIAPCIMVYSSAAARPYRAAPLGMGITWQAGNYGEGREMAANIESEWIALARAVIIQAAKDTAAGDPAAAAWLASDETADTWFLVAQVRRSAVLAWLQRPRILAGTRKGASNKRRKNNQRLPMAAI